jgi:hypothetical protein
MFYEVDLNCWNIWSGKNTLAFLSDEEKILCDIATRLEGPLDSATDSLFQKVGTLKNYYW